MKKFLDYLKKEKIIESFIGLLEEKISQSHQVLIKEYLLELENFSNECKTFENEEFTINFLMAFYERKVSHQKRKELGEFYTSKQIVNHILDAVGYSSANTIENKKLIDISCGSGSFLIRAIARLKNFYLEKYHKNAIDELTSKEGRAIVKSVYENIQGIDINPVACILCQINIHYILFDIYNVIDKNEHLQLPIFKISNINALTWPLREEFDFVVGNPPYLFIRDIPEEQREVIEKGPFKTNIGQYDYYQLFIEQGIKILKAGGYLGYIIPDSMLALSNRDVLRRYIYHTTEIKEILHIGPKFDAPVVSNIIIILKKESEKEKRENNTIRINYATSKKLEDVKITQKMLKNWDYKFLINLNTKDVELIDRLNKNFPKLKDLNKKEGFKISISRGVELAKTGEIIYCKRCELFFPVPKKYLLCPECNFELKIEDIEKIIYEKIPENNDENRKSFISSINRYQIKDNKYIDVSKRGINYKDLNSYTDRIIIRQLSQNNLICATYAKDLSLASQSFYNLKIWQSPVEEFNNEYLLGIINSTLLSYYFIKSFGSYKKLFPRILIEKIKALPVKVPETDDEKRDAIKIVENVRSILDDNKKIELIQKDLDSLIFDLYEIPDKYREYIQNFMRNI